MIVPAALLLVLLPLLDQDIGYLVAWSWILSSIGCVVWGFCILRRRRRIAQFCLAVGFLHLALVILLPLLARIKYFSWEGSLPESVECRGSEARQG